MIGRLRGRLVHLAPDEVVVDVGGVGYRVRIPVSTFYELEGASREEPVVLHVHTHVREDAIQLYGFRSTGELELFELLIGVSGIGPRLAQAALSGMSPEDLRAALAAEDVARLSTIPGVGKKTAQRLVVELKDRLPELPGGAAPAVAAGGLEDLVSALQNLGYRRKEAEAAAAAAAREAGDDAPLASLLRQALQRLSRA